MNHVIVLGSGAAGLSAAIAAASEGASVTLYESTPYIGGTTALSGGVVWFPCTAQAQASGYQDSKEDALTYLRSFTDGDVDDALIVTYVNEGPALIERLSERAGIEWMPVAYPDYHAERPGGRAAGRSLETRPIRLSPEADAVIRKPLVWRLRTTHEEGILQSADPALLADREAQNIQTAGNALIAYLLEAAWRLGVVTIVDSRIRNLRLRDGKVVGVESNDGFVAGSVIVATGGFERDKALARTFLRAPITGYSGAPGARGDGLRMMLEIGAEVGNMSEAWWAPTMHVPGDLIDDEELWRLVHTERSRPGTIIVDQGARRYCNEAQNYSDVGRAMHSFDPGSSRFDRDPSWLIFDEAYRMSYPLGPILAGEPAPPWWISAPTPEELAVKIGVPPQRLIATLTAFNADAANGVDTEFGRGSAVYDRFVGDQSAEHPNLRPLNARPLYAVELRAGLLGTKGGAKTDPEGRVRTYEGAVIPGLYAAGNSSSNCFGLAYPGAGATIGAALLFGERAGVAAATD